MRQKKVARDMAFSEERKKQNLEHGWQRRQRAEGRAVIKAGQAVIEGNIKKDSRMWTDVCHCEVEIKVEKLREECAKTCRFLTWAFDLLMALFYRNFPLEQIQCSWYTVRLTVLEMKKI